MQKCHDLTPHVISKAQLELAPFFTIRRMNKALSFENNGVFVHAVTSSHRKWQKQKRFMSVARKLRLQWVEITSWKGVAGKLKQLKNDARVGNRKSTKENSGTHKG